MAQRPIFAIFEGGGAKGIAHIGAVAACEENFYFAGVAGSSAGAIIATLVAAGFSAREILDPKNPRENLLAQEGETAISLIGRGPWLEWKRLTRRITQASSSNQIVKRWLARIGLYLDREFIAFNFRDGGYFYTDHAREVFNRILCKQVAKVREAKGVPGPHPDPVRFKDLDPAISPEFRRLRVIAANVDTQELAIFDKDRTGEVEVALAVAASIAIPGVFRPVRIPNKDGVLERYMDGGAVSNLPVWVFAADKLDWERTYPGEPPVPIVGFTLKAKIASSPAEPPDDPGEADVDFGPDEPTPKSQHAEPTPEWLDYLGKGLETALSGSQSLIQKFLDDLRVIPLHTDLGTLDFDARLKTMVRAFKDGRRCARRDLTHYLIEWPAEVRRELAEFHRLTRRRLTGRLAPAQKSRRILLRAAIVQPVTDDDFRVTFGHKMDDDADDRLRLDIRGRGATLAWATKEKALARVGQQWPQPQLDYMTKYERALTNKKVEAIVAVPIFPNLSDWDEPNPVNRPKPCGVVAIDANRGAELAAAFEDDHFMSLFKAQSTLLYDVLTKEPERG